jgi:succinoglycan biosynthesis transport protein ExoP
VPYLLVFWKRRLVVLVLLILGVAAGAAVFIVTPPTYRSTSELFVTVQASGADDSSSGRLSGAQFAQDRMDTYAALVDSPSVEEAVVDQLDGAVSLEELRHSVTATVPNGTVILRLSALAPSPARAQEIASAVASQLRLTVLSLESDQASGTSPVNIAVSSEASLPTSPVSPVLVLDLGIGVLGGLFLGGVIAVARERSVLAAAERGRHDRTVPE